MEIYRFLCTISLPPITGSYHQVLLMIQTTIKNQIPSFSTQKCSRKFEAKLLRRNETTAAHGTVLIWSRTNFVLGQGKFIQVIGSEFFSLNCCLTACWITIKLQEFSIYKNIFYFVWKKGTWFYLRIIRTLFTRRWPLQARRLPSSLWNKHQSPEWIP